MKEFNLWRDSNLKSREEILNIILLIPQEKGTRIKKKKKRGRRFRKRNLPECMENVNVYGNNTKASLAFLKLEMPLFTRAEIAPLAMNVTE